MNLSILQIALELAKEICERAKKGEIKELDIMAESVLNDCKDAAVEMIEVIIYTMNEDIRKDKRGRKEQGLVLKEKDRPRQILTHLGMIDFKRDYFYDKKEECHTNILDKMLGIDKYERVGGAVSADLVSRAAECSYAKSTDIVTGGEVSRQTVRNQILKLSLPEVEPREEEKSVKELHIYADEDHAHMQRPGKVKGKKSKIVPLVTVTEGTYTKSKRRNTTINPMHFSTEDFSTSKLWKRVEGYLWKAYDLENVESIYVHGDGGGWIEKGLEDLPQTVHVMDGYHFHKHLRAMCSMLRKKNISFVVLRALEKNDRRYADKYMQGLLDETAEKEKREKIAEFAGYLFGNWEEIRRRIVEDIPGSCTEGLISHTLSERISRNPMGWSDAGLGKVVSARLYIKNGGKITKESFARNDKGNYSDYADRIIEERVKGVFDFSLFEEKNREIMDTSEPIQILMKRAGQMRSILS